MYDVIILGSGPAGFTAAIYAVRAGHKTLVIAGTRWGGQLMLTTLVENFPGFVDGIQGPELMMNMRKQAERLGVEIVNSDVTDADFSKKPFTVSSDGKKFEGKSVIVATGADSIWLNVPGEIQLRGKGVSTCATCDAFFFRGKNVIIVGGGDSAMEEAHVLSNVASSVTIVHRREEFRASKAMQKRIFANPKVRVIWNAALIQYNGTNKLESVDLNLKMNNGKLKFKIQNKDIEVAMKQFNNETMSQFGGGEVISEEKGELIWRIPIDGVFVAIGHKPNTALFKNLELDAKGYVVRKVVHDKLGLMKFFTATNIDGIFTAGDVHDYRYRQAISASALGCMAALDVDMWLMETK